MANLKGTAGTVRRAVVCGTGAYLPANVVTNEALSKRVETSDEWIVARTGIRQRHIAAEDERTSDLATEAARRALAHAGLGPENIDLVIVATTTPDNTFPATATAVQAKLGMNGRGFAFDVQAVCSGFVYAMSIADNFIRVGQIETALVIGAETFTRILDWQDRTTCVLFGDGAGAVVLRAEEVAADTGRGILSCHLHSDGRYKDALFVTGGPGSNREVGVVRMNGQEVFRHAVVKLAEVVEEALGANKLTGADVDWLVPHQANQRIIDGMAKKLGLGPEHVVSTVARHANTSAASIPLALAEAAGDGRIKQGQIVLLEAIGGGLTWGASVIRW
ncbi:MAG: beta-ketoacyl-ACP synthase III [Alphaproteobacteria bacterium]|nr:beta-ketoacyl-ACP synthase III [Alphaproteobacteria bacterium]